MTFDEAVAQLRSAEGAGFGIGTTSAGRIVNKAIRRLASRSRWIREIRNLGNTIPGQYAYTLTEDVLEITSLRLGSGMEYVPCSVRELWDLQNGIGTPVYLDGTLAPGAFADSHISSGVHQLAIFPTPADAQAIMTYGPVLPADYAGAQVLPFPADADEAIENYARGFAYIDIDENPELGGGYITAGDNFAEELRRRANSRAGGGPFQIVPTR